MLAKWQNSKLIKQQFGKMPCWQNDLAARVTGEALGA